MIDKGAEPVNNAGEEEEMIDEEQGYPYASTGASSSAKGKRPVIDVELKTKNGQIYVKDVRKEKRYTAKGDWIRTGNGPHSMLSASSHPHQRAPGTQNLKRTAYSHYY